MKNKFGAMALTAAALTLASCGLTSSPSSSLLSSSSAGVSSAASSSLSSSIPVTSSATASSSEATSSSASSSSAASSSASSSSVAPSLAYSVALSGINADLDTSVSELKVNSVDTSGAYESLYYPYATGTDSDGNPVVFATYDYAYTTDQDVKIYANDVLTNDVATSDVDGTGADVPAYDTDTTTYCYFDASDVYRAIQIDHDDAEAVSGGVMAMPQDWIDEGSTVAEGKTQYIYDWGLASGVLGNLTDADTIYPDTFAYSCEGSLAEGYTFTASFVDPAYSTIYDYFGVDSTYGYQDGPVAYSYSATITVDSQGFLSQCVSSQVTSITTVPLTGLKAGRKLILEDYEEIADLSDDAFVAYADPIPTNPDEVPTAFYGKFYSADGQGHYWIKLMSGTAYIYIYVYSADKSQDVIDGGASSIAYSTETQSLDFTYVSKADSATYAVSLTLDANGDLLVTSTTGDITTTVTYLTAAHYAAQS